MLLYAAMQHITHTHPQYLYAKQSKKLNNERDQCHLLELKRLCICHNVCRGSKYVSEQEEVCIWHQRVLFLSPDVCQ